MYFLSTSACIHTTMYNHSCMHVFLWLSAYMHPRDSACNGVLKSILIPKVISGRTCVNKVMAFKCLVFAFSATNLSSQDSSSSTKGSKYKRPICILSVSSLNSR